MYKRIFSILSIVLLLVSYLPRFQWQPSPVKAAVVPTGDLVLHYGFDQTSGTTVLDSPGNGQNGTLKGGATWGDGKLGNSIHLDGKDGYVQLPSGIVQKLDETTISLWVKVKADHNFQRIFDFSVDTNKNMFLTPNSVHSNNQGLLYSMTMSGNTHEDRISKGTGLETGGWTHLAVTLKGNVGILYENGVEVARNNNLTMKPSDLGNTVLNYIGKSAYPNDPYFEGEIDEFSIFKRALNADEIKNMLQISDQEYVDAAQAVLNLGDTSKVVDNLVLPKQFGDNITVNWTSSNTKIIDTDGIVNRPNKNKGDETVTLTAKLQKGQTTAEKTFTVTVLSELTDSEAVASAKDSLNLDDTAEVTKDISLPAKGLENVNIHWSSSDTNVVKDDGMVIRPANGKGNKTVTLTAELHRGTAKDTKTFQLTVLEQPSVSYNLNVDTQKKGPEISENLNGIFFEEINHAGDGGIYAELVSNRSFEDNASTPVNWSLVKTGEVQGSMSLDTNELLNDVQKHSLRVQVDSVQNGGKMAVSNRGYWGIHVEQGENYNLSLYAKAGETFNGPITVSLESADGKTIYASQTISDLDKEWKRYTKVLTSKGTSTDARLVISTNSSGSFYLDVVSLFPKTWKNRENGLRPDLAQKVQDLKPTFIRFPGGCFVEGDILANRFQWKNTIGDIANRPGHWNLWNYRSTDGLGFHEYLQWAEDLGAEPLYVINVGIAHNDSVSLADIQPYVQDALDALEYANGPVTSKWGALREANGHPAPFNIKYVEIGNENNFQMSDYVKKYPIFYKAIKEKYPDITLIADANVPGQPVDYIDEHYYSSPQWFMDNAYRYDNYDRNGPKIYVGEYAVTSSAGHGNMAAALGEASFMTGMERNSDIVKMSSYAPLFVNDHDRTWNPDAIVFDNARSYGTPSYYVQKMFSNNVGDYILPTTLTKPGESDEPAPITGGIGLGTWSTQVEYDDVKVTNNNGTLFNDDFSNGSNNWNVYQGTWKAENGVYKQTGNATDSRSTAGDAAWTNYTLSLKAKKTSGSEGMLIMFGVKDTKNYYWWNLGGWGNSQHAIEKSVDGSKGVIGQAVPGKIETNRWYDIKIEVSGNHIRCYLDGQLIQEVTDNTNKGPLFYSTSKDQQTGDIIMKIVNTSQSEVAAEINLKGIAKVENKGEMTVLSSEAQTDENSFDHPEKIVPVTTTINDINTTFEHTFEENSVTVLRMKAK